MQGLLRRLPRAGVALSASLLLFALGLLPGLLGMPGAPGSSRPMVVHAASTVYVCGYDDSNPNRNGGWTYWQGSPGTDPCASSGAQCAASGHAQCWISADVHIFTGDTVDWENGTSGHSLGVDANNQPPWPNSIPDGPPGSVNFPSPGVFHYHCNYHSAMIGQVTVTQAPPPSPHPTLSPTSGGGFTPLPEPTDTGTGNGGGGTGTGSGSGSGSGSGGGSSHSHSSSTPGSGTGTSPAAATSPAPSQVAILTSPSPQASLPPETGGGSTGGSGGHPGTGSNEPFGIDHFWVLATVGVLVVGGLMVALGTVMLLRAGRGEADGPTAPA